MIINIHVYRGTKNRRIKENGLDVYMDEPMENNRANAGIIKQLSKFYNVNSKDIKIISGLKSNNVILLL
ncbi:MULTISPECIES: DUF167 family protein [Acidiplasma]|uniref:DUF167 family protein n=1 Tax=Acidiplasma TaxID=507753 RepID=UPI0005DAACD6|nr:MULTISPECIES: DUF167 family protein [unclassified Acidiplasma]KJE50025.1 hypothetical protein TZ01_02925 [Acidiplasma sp. MBA-1]WMT55237.1 MAG: DUF167 family protein [Acidiplasma sp.]